MLALLGSVGCTALLLWTAFRLRRTLRIVRQLSFVLSVAAVAVGLAVYRLTGAALPPGLEQLYSWLLAFLVATAVLRFLGIYIFDIHLRAHRGVQLPPLLAPVTQGLVYLIAGLIIVRLVYPSLSLAPLFTTSAVTSLVLGLALQPILTNLMAGVVIAIEKPFRLNDWIQVGDTEGLVVNITWRTTHLRTRTNDNLILPNGRISEERIFNFHYPNQMHLVRVMVGAHYSAPPYRVRRALLECAPGVDGVLEKPSPNVFVRDYGESAILYELRTWITDFGEVERIMSDLRARIWESFKRHGIVIPFPIRTIEFAPRRPPRLEGEALPRASLFIAEGNGAGVTVRLPDRPFTIGRDAACDLRLDDPRASKEHARVSREADAYVILDLGSSFGTMVNGVKAEHAILQPLDRIAIGGTTLVFETDVL